jgi:SAM-dependent methyltransferase/uncharacterized protein YbaR (Trm112 family)
MKASLVDILVCPQCHKALKLDVDVKDKDSGEIVEGSLKCKSCGSRFPIASGIPRMVEGFGYQKAISRSFGFQWRSRGKRLFEGKTLYGGSVGQEVSQFLNRLGLHTDDLKGKRVLDAGCGSGRLVRALSAYGCDVVGVDLTDLEWAYATNREFPNTHIVQGDIFQLPFAQETFDIVWSEGVIHHTPDPKKAFRCLGQVLKPSGMCYVWVYARSPQARVRRWLKTPRWPRSLLFLLSYLMVIPYALMQAFRILARFRSTAFSFFDALSPTYQSAHQWQEIQEWFEEDAFSDIRVTEDRQPFWLAVWGVGKKR